MISALVTLLVYILVIGLVIWLALFVLDQFPMPEPFGRVARVVIIAVGVIILILLLLDILGSGSVGLPRWR